MEQGRARQLPDRDHPRHPGVQGRGRPAAGRQDPRHRRPEGTGKWTGIEALELGIPLTLIGEAVFARCLSAIKEERVEASKVLPGPKPKFEGDRKAFVEDVRKALYASKMVSYAQGYTLMRAAAKGRGWNLNSGGVARMWRGGGIMRSVCPGELKEAFAKAQQEANDFNSKLAVRITDIVGTMWCAYAFAILALISFPEAKPIDSPQIRR